MSFSVNHSPSVYLTFTWHHAVLGTDSCLPGTCTSFWLRRDGLTLWLLNERTRSLCLTASQLSFIVNYLAACVASCCLHPFHFAEARWVLNNRLPQFSSYRGSYQLFQDCQFTFSRGMSAYLPRNFILAMTGYNYSNSVNMYTYMSSMLFFHAVQYPILTV